MKRGEGTGEGVLEEVLGVLLVAGEAHRAAIELVKEGQGVALEASRALGISFALGGTREVVADPFTDSIGQRLDDVDGLRYLGGVGGLTGITHHC